MQCNWYNVHIPNKFTWIMWPILYLYVLDICPYVYFIVRDSSLIPTFWMLKILWNFSWIFLMFACVPAALKPPSNLRYPRLADDLKLPVRYRSAMHRLMRESDKWCWGDWSWRGCWGDTEERKMLWGLWEDTHGGYQFIAKRCPLQAAKPNLAAVNIDQLPDVHAF